MANVAIQKSLQTLDQVLVADRYTAAYALVGAAEGLKNVKWWVPLLTAAFTKTVNQSWDTNAALDFAAIMTGWAAAKWCCPNAEPGNLFGGKR